MKTYREGTKGYFNFPEKTHQLMSDIVQTTIMYLFGLNYLIKGCVGISFGLERTKKITGTLKVM
jgi:hypothetical protein